MDNERELLQRIDSALRRGAPDDFDGVLTRLEAEKLKGKGYQYERNPRKKNRFVPPYRGGFITSGDTVWLLFRRSAGADEYIGALRQSGIENGLSAEAQALYEAWLEDNPGGEGAEIFTPEEVAFEAEGTPAAVESAAREYVANEAVYWVESSGGEPDGPV